MKSDMMRLGFQFILSEIACSFPFDDPYLVPNIIIEKVAQVVLG